MTIDYATILAALLIESVLAIAHFVHVNRKRRGVYVGERNAWPADRVGAR